MKGKGRKGCQEEKRAGEEKDIKQDKIESFKQENTTLHYHHLIISSSNYPITTSPLSLLTPRLITSLSIHIITASIHLTPLSSSLTMDREAVTTALSLSLLPLCVLSP